VKLWSNSWGNGDPIPPRLACGVADGQGAVRFGDNLNPHLAWSGVPEAARSLAVVCHDFDVPVDRSAVNRAGRELDADVERADFFHWLLVDLPPGDGEIAEGEFSRGFVPRGKPGPATHRGHARQGLNDYTAWFEGDAERSGRYFGYDGPFPPWNDALVHHYVFTLYAVVVPVLELPEPFRGRDVWRALAGRVLAEATLSGTYTLNPRLAAAA
jgi:Raf kinase inhibitor-like YbhB/YbcL family protein